MVESGYVSEDQLEEALSAQAQQGENRLLGQIIIARGYATTPQVQVALARQHKRVLAH